MTAPQNWSQSTPIAKAKAKYKIEAETMNTIYQWVSFLHLSRDIAIEQPAKTYSS
jgi:hypothetical protein